MLGGKGTVVAITILTPGCMALAGPGHRLGCKPFGCTSIGFASFVSALNLGYHTCISSRLVLFLYRKSMYNREIGGSGRCAEKQINITTGLRAYYSWRPRPDRSAQWLRS
jgi:hypothetical protein